jgi:hypothetical protein
MVEANPKSNLASGRTYLGEPMHQPAEIKALVRAHEDNETDLPVVRMIFLAEMRSEVEC